MIASKKCNHVTTVANNQTTMAVPTAQPAAAILTVLVAGKEKNLQAIGDTWIQRNRKRLS